MIRDAKPQQTDGVGTVFHFPHQLLGERQDIVFRLENMVNGDASGDLLEIEELHLQRQRPTLKLALLDATDELDGSMIEFDGDSCRLADILLKRLFATHRLTLPFRNDGPVVDASGEIVEHLPHLAELLGQMSQRVLLQVRSREDTHPMHLLCRLLAHPSGLRQSEAIFARNLQ